MKDIREMASKIIQEFDNESSFLLLIAAATIPHLEEPINRARFFNYDKKLELYFDSKDLNRFSRLKELTEIITKRINAKKITNFEKTLKEFRDNQIIFRDKEGPTDGISWKGFGGVHSHYSLTPIGKALLVFQTTLRCSSISFNKIEFKEKWDEFLESEVNIIITLLANKKLKIQYQDNCFYSKNNEESRIIQLIFEFIAGAPANKISQNELQAFINDKAGELFLGYIPIALDRLNPLIAISGNNIMLNERGYQLRIGYSSLLTEIAVALDEIELAHFMIASNSLENGSKNIIANYAFYF